MNNIKNIDNKKPIEYYIHIPFCVRKCNYCDFLSFSSDSAMRKRYVEELCKEIIEFDPQNEYQITSLFLGGGTPSILKAEEIKQIMNCVQDYHLLSEDAEITIESNPGTLDAEKLEVYRMSGINRLSMGVQSFDDEELQMLGRIHRSEEVYKSFELARSAGFTNINLDLMSSLPGQDTEKFLRNLKEAVNLNPEHISAYSLIIEEGTPFFDTYEEDEIRKEAGDEPRFLPSEEEERNTYYKTKEFLEKHRYQRYEISNYAKPGKECRHNIGYWERAEYQGFGLGAASLIGNTRFSNTTDLNAYLNGERAASREVLSAEEQMEEAMFLGLRMMKGVDKEKFLRYFKKQIEEVYPQQIQDLTAKKLLINGDRYVYLTDKGVDLANLVMGEFLK